MLSSEKVRAALAKLGKVEEYRGDYRDSTHTMWVRLQLAPGYVTLSVDLDLHQCKPMLIKSPDGYDWYAMDPLHVSDPSKIEDMVADLMPRMRAEWLKRYGEQ